MNTSFDILAKYRNGEISISECWNLMAGIRQAKTKTEIVLTQPPSKNYEALNECELEAIRNLQSVHFGMSRGAKRFAHQIKDCKELTARQREYLRGLVFKYRRQLWRDNPDGNAKSFCSRMKGDL